MFDSDLLCQPGKTLPDGVHAGYGTGVVVPNMGEQNGGIGLESIKSILISYYYILLYYTTIKENIQVSLVKYLK